MKTTSNRHVGADEQDYALRPHTTPRAGEGGSNAQRGSPAGTGIRRTAGAIGAVALLAVLGTLPPPAAEAATCTALERGSWSGSTFTAGTSSTDNDSRVSCTGDASDKRVTTDDLYAAIEHADADAIEDDGFGTFVIHLTNAYLDFGDHDLDGSAVLLGTVSGDSGRNGVWIAAWDGLPFWEDLEVDSRATVSTSGGGMGISVASQGGARHYETLRVRNFGSITTTGGGSSDGNRRARGMNITSNGGPVEAVNESGGSVTTRGPSARGVVAGTVGAIASAINRGTITTHGSGFLRGGSLQGSAGLYSWADGAGGVAQSVNESGGAINTHGAGSRGIGAVSSSSASNLSIATNRGSVTTRGNRLVIGTRTRDANGVHAWVANGISRATNETGASIRTYGTGASGLSAGNSEYLVASIGQRAEAVNRGTITTSGHQSGTTRAHGMEAWSTSGTATSVNHGEGTVITTGRGARGVQASTGDGAASETAVARNHGTVITRGGGFHGSTWEHPADGLGAFTGGEARAMAENGADGVIETHGQGAKGVIAFAWRGNGEAIARNRGEITTAGDAYRADRTGTDNDDWLSAIGLSATAENSDATAINEIGGEIETTGDVAWGMHAMSRGYGTATAVNRGRVTTRGESADDLPGAVGRTLGARGISVYSRHGIARAGNGATGRVDTHGRRAFGVFAESAADGSRTSGTIEAVNRGQVHTRGWNADGVVANARHPGTADNPNHVRATNSAGASVTTEGSGASGLGASVFVPAWNAGDPITADVACTGTVPVVCPTFAPAASTVIARNDGTVVTGVVEAEDAVGDDVSMEAGATASNGVAAAFFSSAGTTIASAGDVTVINTGDVTVKRVNATGLYAETFGSGTATVRMTGGSVSAEGANARGLWARTGTTGTVDATIAGGAEIAAASSEGIAAQFEGGTTNVRLLDSVLDGRVEFDTGTDTFTVRDSRVTGAIDFGAGSDTLSAHGDTWLEGAVSNLETLTKRGSGSLVMGGDVSFSSEASAKVENGGLVFTGQFDLGATGTMRIHDAARLTAVLVDTAAPPQITAGGITFDGDEELFVQVSPDISAASESTYRSRLTTATGSPIANGTTVTGRTGQVALRTARGPSTVVDVGHIPLVNGATSTAGTVVTPGVRLGGFTLDAPEDLTEVAISPETLGNAGTGTAGSGGPGLSLGGGVGTLGSVLFDVFDAETASFAPDEAQQDEVLPAAGLLGAQTREGGLEYWTRFWAGDAPVLAGGAEATVRGVQMGVDSPMGSSLRLGFSVAPEVSVSSASGARLGGTRYAVRGGWRGKHLHAGASVSQGRYRAHSVMDNPVAGGGLSSAFGLVQDHVQAGAGARMTWGAVQVAPSVSVLSGALRHDAHTAEGAVFRAEVPAFSQRYHGWKSELEVSPARWLRGPKSLRWRPALHLYTQHTRSAAPASLEFAQHDRAGVLSLSSAGRVSGLPSTVHGFNATVDALGSRAWRVQLGLAGMESDGDYDQAVYARLHMRF